VRRVTTHLISGSVSRPSCGDGRAAFTLLELLVVIALISMIVAVAFPQLLPVIAFSNHEGAARHLAAFGRAAMAECVFKQEHFTINVDLENQEYWAMRWVLPEDSEFLEEAKSDRTKRGDRFWDTERSEQTETDKDTEALLGKFEKDARAQAMAMRKRFDQLAKIAATSRARNVKRPGILDEIGPLFEEEFTLGIDLESEEEEFEEVRQALLLRTKLPEGVRIESVMIGGTEHTEPVVEFEITPFGLGQPVAFYIKDQSDDYFTVTWDAITGGAHLRAGKEAVL